MRAIQRGFTLIEMVIVVGVMGLMLTLLIGMTASLVTQQRLQTTRSRLANIDTALALYVTQYKRLPCPADGTIASSTSTSGVENSAGSGAARTCVGNQQNGVVPWRALGISATDIEDGWGNRFTYRVGPDLVKDSGMDFTYCDAAGTEQPNPSAPPYCNTACASGSMANCTPPRFALKANAVGKGVVVVNISNAVIMDPRGTPPIAEFPTSTVPPAGPDVSTGAAYVVISHGAEGGGAYNSAGVLQSSTVSAGTMEAMNFANLAYTTPPASTAAPTSYLVDDAYAGAGAGHFDDIVSRPNILTVATRAGTGPRAH